jgi:hypothetical protein
MRLSSGTTLVGPMEKMWLAGVADVVAPTLLAVSQCFPCFVPVISFTRFGTGLQLVADGGARWKSAAIVRCSSSYYHPHTESRYRIDVVVVRRALPSQR